MTRMRYALMAVVLASMLVPARPWTLAAAHEPNERERAEQMAREAMEKLMRALELLFESIPQYEMPEINEDGDIIIRRKHRPRRKPPVEPEFDETTT